MASASLKEKAVFASLGMVALYALAVGLWFMRQEGEWSKARKAYEKACKTYADETKLISEKSKWSQTYEDEKSAMPIFEEGKVTDTTWLEKMDRIAATNCIQISNRQGGKEIEAGEVLELPIDVRNWEGSFEALVRFMHEVENTSEGMFDISAISFKPSNRKGYFRGSFTLNCAYMRER